MEAVTSVTYCVLTQNELETTASLKGNWNNFLQKGATVQ